MNTERRVRSDAAQTRETVRDAAGVRWALEATAWGSRCRGCSGQATGPTSQRRPRTSPRAAQGYCLDLCGRSLSDHPSGWGFSDPSDLGPTRRGASRCHASSL